MPEVIDHVRHVIGRPGDPRLVPPPHLHLRQVLPAQARVMPQVLPEIIPRSRVQKVQVSLADRDVVNGRAAVKLLVPLAQKDVLNARPVTLFDPVSAQNVQNSHADVVTIPTAPGA